MKSIDLKGHLRTEIGKKGSKSLRKEGNVPCELYGGENVHFYVSEIALKKVIYTPNTYMINLDIDGKKYQAVMRESQFHPVTGRTLHIDFEQVSNDKPVKVKLPLVTEGAAPGVLNGGKLKINMRKVFVQGLLDKLPEEVKIDISSMKIGNSIRVKDLNYEGVTILDPQSNVLVSVATSRNAIVDDEPVAEEAEKTEAAAE